MSLSEKIHIFKREALRRPGALASTVLLTSLFMLAVGLLWNEKYESSATVLVERDRLIAPLMKGATVTQEIPESQSELATQIIHSRSVLEEVMQRADWPEEESMTLKEREALMERIKKNMKIENVGLNMLEISYRDTDPERAFRVVTAATSLLINRANDLKQAESKGAYKFIAAEVDRYQEKLKESEQRLKQFLAKNGNVRLGNSDEVGGNVMNLRQRIQDARLDLEAARITERELTAQLENSDSAITTISREDEIADRIAVLQDQLQELRLQYHDTYPDIVSIKDKIASLRAQMDGAPATAGDEINVNPMRQEIRRELLRVRTEIAGLERRIQESERLLESEYARGVDVAEVEAQAEALSRDYEITQEIYQDLLKRRESAQLAVNMEEQGEGAGMGIQEPPAVPMSPSGLNFMHFALAGPLLGVLLALGTVLLRVQYDDRIRAGSTISRDLAIPVLGSVPVLEDASVRSSQRRAWIAAVGAVGVLVVCYAFVISLRVSGLL